MRTVFASFGTLATLSLLALATGCAQSPKVAGPPQTAFDRAVFVDYAAAGGEQAWRSFGVVSDQVACTETPKADNRAIRIGCSERADWRARRPSP